MDKYYSRLSTSDYAFFASPPYVGRGWQITFDKSPDFDRASSSTIINGIKYPSKSIIIHAVSQERAQYVSDLVHAAFFLINSDRGLLIPYRSEVIKLDSSGLSGLSEKSNETDGPLFISTSDFPLACLIARKASYRRYYQNAIFKYMLSFEIFPASQFELDPSNWLPKRGVYEYPDHYTRCAYAIVIAYSVIEEISLEIRASQSNPSFINGKWNLKVKNELENRLKTAGIDIDDTVPWVMRDTPTRIEKLRPPEMFTSAEWSYGKIRDIEMEVSDAISYASWLRSRVGAHRLTELSGALTYYDVANVQHLARRLLLEKMGFWEAHDNNENEEKIGA